MLSKIIQMLIKNNKKKYIKGRESKIKKTILYYRNAYYRNKSSLIATYLISLYISLSIRFFFPYELE